MKPGIYLSRLVDDPVSQKRFLLALVIVIALHLIFLAIWKLPLSAPVVKKNSELVIELGMPPLSGVVGLETTQTPLTQASLGQSAQPTKTAPTTPAKVPGFNDTASKPGSLIDQAPKNSEGPAVPLVPSASTLSQASSQAPTQVLNSTATPTGPVETSSKPSESPAAPASPVVLPQASGAKEVNDAVRTAEADYKAAYLNNPRPAYPRLAHRMGIEGTVILLADVSEDGATLQVRLLQSSGNDLLDQSALSTVSQWRFTPARKDGAITRSTVRIPITFSLKVQAKK